MNYPIASFPVTPSTPQSDIMKWHTTGKNTYDAALLKSEYNYMNKFVVWLRDPSYPPIAKASAVVFGVLLVVGVSVGMGLLAGHIVVGSIVCSFAVAIPTLIWGAVEWNDIENDAKEAVLRQQTAQQTALEQAAAFQKMKDAIGGDAAFNRLPVLNIGNRMGGTGYLNFIKIEEMSHSIMKGVDSVGRPFIVFRLRSNRAGDPQDPFVVTFFQRYTAGGAWVDGTCYHTHNGFFFNTPVSNAVRNELRSIVVTCNHSSYSLA